MQHRRVLISGGAGFIGSALALGLIETGCEIRVLDNLSEQVHGKTPDGSPLYRKIRGKVDFMLGSVDNREDWEKALRDVEVVVHLAAETGTGQSMYEISRYIGVNVRGTSLLLDLLTNGEHQVKRVVLASSRAIYGEGKYFCAKHGNCFPRGREERDLSLGVFEPRCQICGEEMSPRATDEDSILHPTSVYGATKRAQEELVLLCGESVGISSIALRYQNVYGPGQSLTNPYTGILSIFSTQFRNGQRVNVFEDGKESRDFVFLNDAVDAIIAAIASPDVVGAYNVGSGRPVSVLTVAETLRELLGGKGEIVITGVSRTGDIRHNFADISRIRSALGWTPKTDFQVGTKAFVDWVKGQGPGLGSYDKSMEELQRRGLLRGQRT